MKMKYIIFTITILSFITACSSMGLKQSKRKGEIDTENALFEKAETQYKNESFDQAIAAYSQYISRYPDGKMIDAAFLKLGITHQQVGKNDQALTYLEQLIQKFPKSPFIMDARIEILSVYLKQGRFRKLEQDATAILKDSLHATQRLKVYGLLGDRSADMGNAFDAVQYYDKMLQLISFESRSTVFDRVQSVVDQLSMGQTKHLLDQLPAKGVYSHLLYHLGKLHFTAKNFEASEAVFRELTDKFPNFRENKSVAQILDSIASGEAFKPYTLGCLLPLSGSYAAYGQRALQGIEMALVHFSQKASNFTPKLVVKDTQSDPEHARNALQEMAKEGVAAVIGPMVTTESVAMEADALGVPMITLTQKEYITDSSPYIFRNFITPEMQVKALVNFTSKTLGAKRYTILYPNENYGTTFMNLFWDEVVVHDGTIVGAESYNVVQTDFADAIMRLVGLYYPMSQDARKKALDHVNMLRDPKEALEFFESEEENLLFPDNKKTKKYKFGDDVDDKITFMNEEELEKAKKDSEEEESIVDFNAIFIPDSPKKVGLIIPQLAFYDIRDVYLLGTNIWHSDSLIHMSRRYLSNAIVIDGFFVESEDYNIRKFVSDFSEVYNEKPEIFAATAYDSALIILNLLKDPTIELRSQVKDHLLIMPPYKGITGKTAFRPNGEVSKDLFILGIRNNKFVEIGQLNPNPVNIELISKKMVNPMEKPEANKAQEKAK
jgi:branched-chain amino acid transport system substrate-binding protein